MSGDKAREEAVVDGGGCKGSGIRHGKRKLHVDVARDRSKCATYL